MIDGIEKTALKEIELDLKKNKLKEIELELNKRNCNELELTPALPAAVRHGVN